MWKAFEQGHFVVDVGKRARVLLKELKGLERTKRTKRT